MRKLLLLSISVAIAICCFGASGFETGAKMDFDFASNLHKAKMAEITKDFGKDRIKSPSTPSAMLPGGKGQKRALVLPLYFEDQKYTYIIDSVRAKFEKGTERSLGGYFYDASGGQMLIDFGSKGISDWIRMPKKVADYGLKYGSYDGWDKLFQDVDSIIAKMDNLSEFDLDGNGNPDTTILLWAGNSWTIGGPMPGNFAWYGEDGSSYICLGEDVRYGFPMITVIHEYAHASIPLWDLYDYSYTSSPIGGWDLMADGVWQSYCGLTAYHRWKSGWIEPITITEPGTYYVDDLNGDGPNKMFKIPIPGSPDEWLLVENRSRKGCDGYFQGAPDHGMVVYHVDDSREYAHRFNTLGTDRAGKSWRTHGISVLDPSGSVLHVGASYGADKGRTRITPYTTPNTLPYRKADSDKSIHITDISARGARMSFKVDFLAPERPIVSVDQQVFFGKIVKGKTATKEVNFKNSGVGKLFIQMKPAEQHIQLDRSSFIGNDETINITVDATNLKIGKYTTKINYQNQSSDATGYIECIFEVVPIEGDLNANGKVELEDIEKFWKQYGKTAEDDDFDSTCDFNSDGKVDIIDFMLLSRNYNHEP